MISLLAKIYDVEKTIATIRELGLKSLIETVGIDFAASPELQCAKAILRYARDLHPLKATPIHGGDVFIVEMHVENDSRVKGQSLKDSDILSDIIVGAIIRDERIIIPHGNETLKENDKVILFTLEDMIQEIEEIF